MESVRRQWEGERGGYKSYLLFLFSSFLPSTVLDLIWIPEKEEGKTRFWSGLAHFPWVGGWVDAPEKGTDGGAGMGG